MAKKEKLWQTDPNSMWFTNIKPTCDRCGKVCDAVTEFKIPGSDSETIRACMELCSRPTEIKMCKKHGVDYLASRGIKWVSNIKEKRH